MKKKLLFLGLSFILVASLISASALTSCSKTSTTTSAAITTTTSTPIANTPQYGGTLTVLNPDYTQNCPGFDPQLNQLPWIGSIWVTPFTDWLATGDIEKYGPRGNNTFAFQINENVPEQYLGGQVLTGWTINLNSKPITITLNVRHGIMWSGNTLDGMKPRELTADDVAYTMKRAFTAPTVAGTYTFVTSVTTPDMYTVVLGLSQFDSIWAFDLLYGLFPGNTICPEWGDTKAPGGSEAWQNTVSDGPFTITNYVDGVGGTFTRNPNYWGKTTINGKTYNMPFIDTLIYPIIPDEATAVASLRTGKIDWWSDVPETYASSLNSTSLLSNTWTTGAVDTFVLNRLDNQYLKNKAVRQALTMATDFTSIKNLLYPGGNLFDFPAMAGDAFYVPLNQMPANIQDMYSYDPTKAQQMLTAAGYPKGFSLAITVDSTVPLEQDVAQLLANQWAKVNVTATINSVDPTVLESDTDNLKYDLCYFGMDPTDFVDETNRVLSTAIGATYLASEPFDKMWTTMDTDPNLVTQVTEGKALAVAILDDAGWIAMPDPIAGNYWWPWVKNYYKEIETGYRNKMPIIDRIWIDQSLKKSTPH